MGNEKHTCIICSGGEHNLLYRNEEVAYVMCERCSLISLYPRLSKEEYATFYKESYQKHRHAITDYNQAVEIRKKKGFKGKQTYIDELKPFMKGGMSVFEIGCGWGTFLRSLHDTYGVKVSGLEPSSLTSKVAREFYNLSVETATLDEYLLRHKEQTFDLIVLMHVLEHFVDPEDALLKIQKLMHKNSLLFIAVPNTAKPNEPLDRFFHFEHCYYFTPLTLETLLKKHGLKIVWLNTKHNDIRLLATRTEHPFEAVMIDEALYPKDKVVGILKRQERKYAFLRVLKRISRILLPRPLFVRVRARVVAILKKLKIVEV